MRENLKLGMTLFIITAIAGLLLGLAYEVTKEPIAKQARASSLALDETLPQAKEPKSVEVEIPEDSVVKEVNAGYDGDKLVGYIIKVEAKGFHGPIEMVVGISEEGKIEGLKIISHSETPGLGAKITEDAFKGQFVGKSIDSPLEVVKGGGATGNQIDAITGATISSNGVTSAINDAVEFYRTAIKGEEAEPEKTKESLVKEILANSDKMEAAGLEIAEGASIKEVDKIYEGDTLLGYAFLTAPKGFHGEVETVVVISTEGKIEGLRILKHSETPGLGAEAEKEAFWSQFTGKSVESPVEIDAISGATITTNAIKGAVNEIINFYRTAISGEAPLDMPELDAVSGASSAAQ